jgi:hypothetical protein
MAFPQTPLDLRAELKLGDSWADITAQGDVRLAQEVAITRGRSDEAAQVDRSTATMRLNNRAGRYSPRNPVGAYYGLIGKNTPIRLSLPADPYLDLPGTAGAKASAPDSTALSITGDIDVRIDLTLSNWRQLWQICGKYKTTGNQRSWALQLDATGLLTWYWSTDGTLANRVTVKSTVPVPAQPGRLALRATLDVDNGSSGNTVTFYTADTIDGTWVQLGAPVVTAGTTSVFDSTSSLEVGEVPDFAGPTVNSLVNVHGFELRSGIGGTLVADLDFARALFGQPYLVGTPVAQASGVSATVTLTATTPVPAGHMIRLVLGSSGGSAVNTVADSKGNTYSLARSAVGGTPRTHLYTATAATALAAGDTITATMSTAANAYNMIVAASSGVLAVDVSGDASGTSTAPSVTSPTLGAAYELAVAAISNGNGGGAPSWAAGWTVLSTQHNGSTHWTSAAYKTTSTTTAVTASATIVSAAWTALVVTFTPAATNLPGGPFVDAYGNVWTLAGGATLLDRRWRFHGEVSSWPQQWDLTGGDAWVPIEASGIMRRLGTGSNPLESTIRRGLTTQAATTPLEYWPCEDAAGSTSLASALDGGKPMVITVGAPSLGSFDGFKASKPLPLLTNSSWVGLVRGYTPTGFAQCRFLLAFPSTGAPTSSTVIGLQTTGSAAFWYLTYTSGSSGGLTLNMYDRTGTLITSSGTATGYNGVLARWSLELTQNGADVDWLFGRTRLDNPYNFAGTSGTLAGQTFGAVTKVFVNVGAFIDDTAVGHISVHKEITSIFDIADELTGFDGEPASRRIARLCGEEGVAFQSIGGYGSLTSFVGNLAPADDTSELLGPQLPLPFLDLVREAAAADTGMLYEPREIFGLGYRTRASMYNQTPRATIGYSAHELSDVPAPVDDDQLLANDITVTRTDGSSARAVQTSGPNNVNSPDDDPDGVGRYPGGGTFNVATDGQLPHQAEWRRTLGVTTDQRFPSLPVNLASNELVANPALAEDLRQVEVGDLIAVTGPMPHQAPDDVNQIVQGIRETPYSKTHGIVYTGSPADPYRVAVWDTDRYDTAGSELVAAATTTDAALTVVTTSGPAWTTAAADAPFDIALGGERVTVTAVTGAAVDAFGRSVSSGWGTPDIGPAWTTSGGSASDHSVTGSAGRQAQNTVNVFREAVLGVAFADVDLYASFSSSVTPAGAPHNFQVLARRVDANNAYELRVSFTTGSAVQMHLQKIVAGVTTALTTLATVPGLTHSGGTKFRNRFQVMGSDVRGKIWLASATEPSAWNASATDTDITASGQVSLRGKLDSGNTNTLPVNFDWDDFQVANPQIFTATRSVNGVIKSHSAGAALSLWQPARWAF